MNALLEAVENADPPSAAAFDPCSHLANALRIVTHYGHQLLYVDGIGWHVWETPWRLDELEARRIVQGLGAIIASEAADLSQWVAAAPNSAERKQREEEMARRFKWARASELEPCIEHSLRMAAPRLACKADQLDADPMLLGLPNGVLELDTGAHRPYRRSDRITKTTGCEFAPQATAPTWERFIGEIFAGDPGMIDYVQTLAGYALCGNHGEHLLPILWGSGSNGKSTFLGALQATLGDYAGSAAPGLLIQRAGAEHPTALADLQGKRLVVISETGEFGKLNEELVKLLTGGDSITARRMRQDFYTFRPTHQFMLQTNHKPRVTGTDDGVWRRLKLIPFTTTIGPDKRDPELPAKLRAELPGILAWCWQGWQRYHHHRFDTPQAVMAATGEYRAASDAIGAFIDDCCYLDPRMTASASELYHAYSAWCENTGERPMNKRDFGTRLMERGLAQDRGTHGVRRWRGIGLQAGDTGDVGDAGFGMNATRSSLMKAHTGNSATHVTQVTQAEAYRAAKEGE